MKPTPVTISGSTALVTGAGSGIGRATALALGSAGARVLAADLDPTGAEKTAADCGGRAFEVDVSDPERVRALAAEVIAGHGAPDIVVNNAGVGMSARFLDMDLDDWTWIIGINLLGAVHISKAFGPAMIERGSGHVVNVASGLAYTPRATEPGYVTTKAAVLAFTRCLRADWHDRGIGVSAICPGVINTNIVRSNTRYKGERADAATISNVQKAFKRGHPPEKVADAIVDAVRRNRSVVPVGFEATFGWVSRSLIPTRLADLGARTQIRGL
ncbi:MAG: SDR family NAD(P)-dependent oxidoreductase [Actinomycetota bacterium]|nr:SDR family NAD(P)-dependent oxidoreductase [Actinomycetota bacterium]